MVKVFIMKYPKFCNRKMQPIKTHLKDMVLKKLATFLNRTRNLLVCGCVRSNMDQLLNIMFTHEPRGCIKLKTYE